MPDTLHVIGSKEEAVAVMRRPLTAEQLAGMSRVMNRSIGVLFTTQASDLLQQGFDAVDKKKAAGDTLHLTPEIESGMVKVSYFEGYGAFLTHQGTPADLPELRRRIKSMKLMGAPLQLMQLASLGLDARKKLAGMLAGPGIVDATAPEFIELVLLSGIRDGWNGALADEIAKN